MFASHRNRGPKPARDGRGASKARRRASRPIIEALEGRELLATFTVTNTADSGAGSLRQAILSSNAATGSTNTITFDIGTGRQTITPLSPLPALTQAVVVNGTTQPGIVHGRPVIVLDGASAGSSADGLDVAVAGCTIEGLVIDKFSGNGIVLSGGGGSVVKDYYIGIDVTATLAEGNGGDGIEILNSARNTIGGTVSSAENLISASSLDGVYISGATSSQNVLEANSFGNFDRSATQPLNNHQNAIELASGANGNTIGTMVSCNDIEGSDQNGILITGAGTSNNVIEGDSIIGAETNGVEIAGGATTNTIGTTAGNFGNFVDGNTQNGILITGAGTSNNVIDGNTIQSDGTNGVEIANGAAANTVGGTVADPANLILHNAGNGLLVTGAGTSDNAIEGYSIDYNGTNGVEVANDAAANTVGGTVAGSANVIWQNASSGLLVTGAGTSNNAIAGNSIEGNGTNGVEIADGATANTVGTTVVNLGNVIDGNCQNNVLITDAGTSNNVIAGNFIGTDPTMMGQLINAIGVDIANGASGDTVGGTASGTRNIISDNPEAGVLITGTGTSRDVVEGDYIGTDATGTVAQANGNGVVVENSASNNTIGGTTTAARDVIAGNAANGVQIAGSGTANNVVEGDFIGLKAAGNAALANRENGVQVVNGAAGNTIGGTTSGARDVISGNLIDGVQFDGGGTSSNLVAGDYLGTDATGKVAVANGRAGVYLYGGASQNTIGGTSAAARDLISGDAVAGIVIDAGCNANVVEGDYIGSDVTGALALANGGNGVTITNGAAENTIGGTASGAANLIYGNKIDGVLIETPLTGDNSIQGNTIEKNEGDGVQVDADGNIIGKSPGGSSLGGNAIFSNGAYGVRNLAVDNPVLANSIYSNGVGGILNSTFVEPAPALTSVSVSGDVTTVNGSITGSPFFDNLLTIEFFTNSPGSGNQGQTFVLETQVATGPSGNATFSVQLGAALSPGLLVTATSTDANGNTSQFSNAVAVPGTTSSVVMAVSDSSVAAVAVGQVAAATAAGVPGNASASRRAATATSGSATGSNAVAVLPGRSRFVARTQAIPSGPLSQPRRFGRSATSGGIVTG